MRSRVFRGVLLVATAALCACRQDMHDQPKAKALRGSVFFADGRSARPAIEGTVARGMLREDLHLYFGKIDGKLAATFPFPLTRAVLERGHQRFDVFCSPCHGRLGNGQGMVVSRGFKQPTSFHDERLLTSPPGHYFDVMTNGFGAMQDYSAQVPVEDRWAIAAYIRALQLSQNAHLSDVPKADREELDKAPAEGRASPPRAGSPGPKAPPDTHKGSAP
jgi:mono/diheme cytochrome c family protein